ncbi:MAG TPA: ABC transporter, partial [Clostridiaceae bacterium]|nr:ABC transporter [Clostridiaceae bacterium]
MKRVFRYIWKYKLFLIIPFCAMLLGVVLDMLNPYIAGTFVDKVILKKQLNILWMVLAGVGGVSAGRMVLGYVKEYMYDILSSKVAVDLRKDLFDHIQELPFKFFDNMSTGELMSRMTGDIDNIWRSISFGIGLFVENAIYFITAGAILFTLNVKLTLISLFTMPLIAYIAFKLEKRVDEAYQKLSDQGVILNTTAEENIAGVRLVKAFGREKHEICKFLRHNKKNADLSIEQARIWGTYHPMIEFLGNFTVIAVVS